MGAISAKGVIVVPFVYTYVRQVEGRNYFIVSSASQEFDDAEHHYGVIDNNNRSLIPLKYSAIDYDRRYKRFKVSLQENA